MTDKPTSDLAAALAPYMDPTPGPQAEPAKPIPLPPRPAWADAAVEPDDRPMRAAVTADVSDGSKDRLHDLVEAKRAEIVHRWPAASPMDRQALLTELSQLVQLEALASGHIVQPDSALGHRHNSLVATAAQSIMANSLKIDEHQFKKQQADIIPELLRRIAEAKIQLGRPSATIDLRPMTENNHD